MVIEWKCGQSSSSSQCGCGWSVRGKWDTTCLQWNCLWKCTMWSATQSMMCCVVQLSTSSLVFTLSCFSFRMLLYTLPSQFSYCSSSSNSFPRNYFSHMLTLHSHGILGVVFTPPVGYSRPPSAVNDPTVTKPVNSGKSCLEEMSQLLFYQVFLTNQNWVHLHGDFRKNKE